MDEQTSLNEEIKKTFGMYKISSLCLLASIVAYVFCLFFVKSAPISIALAVVMMVLAIWNTFTSRKITRLNNQKKQADLEAAKASSAEGGLTEGQENLAEPIVANATSLNDLPKDYTVLDDVDLDGTAVKNIVVSPYGIAVVGEETLKPVLEQKLKDLEVEAPIYFYDPQEPIAVLAENIQMPKTIVLDEPSIYKILYRLSGLK